LAHGEGIGTRRVAGEHLALGLSDGAGDEHVEVLATDLTSDEGAGEGGVERLHHRCRLGNELLDLLGGGAAPRRGQAVPGLGVDWVGDVDDDLAGELIGVLPDGVLDARIVDREDDHLTTERRSGIERGGGAAEFLRKTAPQISQERSAYDRRQQARA